MNTPRLLFVILVAALMLTTAAPALDAAWSAATDVPVTAAGYTATGQAVNFTLSFTPATGTDLTVVKNTVRSGTNGAGSWSYLSSGHANPGSGGVGAAITYDGSGASGPMAGVETSFTDQLTFPGTGTADVTFTMTIAPAGRAFYRVAISGP